MFLAQNLDPIRRSNNLSSNLVALALAGGALLCAGCSSGTPGFGHTSFQSSNFDAEFTRTDELALELRADEPIVLTSSYGAIEVVVDPLAAPSLRAEIHARGRTNAVAQAALDRAHVDIEYVGGALTIEFVVDADAASNSRWSDQVFASADFFVTVPALTNVSATTSGGDIETHGRLGPVHLETKYGDIAIDRAQGDVFAKSSSGSIAAVELAGDQIWLECSYGDVAVQSASGASLTMHSGSGDIELAAAEVDQLSLSTNYGDIRATRIAGSLTASSSSGAIDVAELSGAVEATSQYGDVHIEGRLSEVAVKAASADVVVHAREGSRALSDWKLISSYGNVTLYAPADFACRLDATTNYGDIECGFGMFVEAGARSGRHLSGAIGGGGPSVVLATSSGDVALLAR